MSRIVAQSVSYRVDGTNLLENVSFTLNSGKVIALIGPNGSGKSTLLRCILGIIKPTDGKITLDGKDILSFSATSLAKHISYLPQEKKIAWPGRVKDIVALGRFAKGVDFKKLAPSHQHAINRAMQLCQISEIADRSVASLSGGELARVHFARALASDAHFLMADEPLASLDVKHQRALGQIMKTNTREGACNLVVMHELPLAVNFADRLLWLKNGHVIAEGTVKDTLTRERIRTVFEVDSKIDWQKDICNLSFN